MAEIRKGENGVDMLCMKVEGKTVEEVRESMRAAYSIMEGTPSAMPPEAVEMLLAVIPEYTAKLFEFQARGMSPQDALRISEHVIAQLFADALFAMTKNDPHSHAKMANAMGDTISGMVREAINVHATGTPSRVQ